jgi:hypothetical protein
MPRIWRTLPQCVHLIEPEWQVERPPLALSGTPRRPALRPVPGTPTAVPILKLGANGVHSSNADAAACGSGNAQRAVPRRGACLGFQYEGMFRQATVYKARNRDTCWFSILDSEWPALKRGFERWLEPANFDAQGHQKRNLASCTERPRG